MLHVTSHVYNTFSWHGIPSQIWNTLPWHVPFLWSVLHLWKKSTLYWIKFWNAIDWNSQKNSHKINLLVLLLEENRCLASSIGFFFVLPLLLKGWGLFLAGYYISVMKKHDHKCLIVNDLSQIVTQNSDCTAARRQRRNTNTAETWRQKLIP